MADLLIFRRGRDVESTAQLAALCREHAIHCRCTQPMGFDRLHAMQREAGPFLLGWEWTEHDGPLWGYIQTPLPARQPVAKATMRTAYEGLPRIRPQPGLAGPSGRHPTRRCGSWSRPSATAWPTPAAWTSVSPSSTRATTWPCCPTRAARRGLMAGSSGAATRRRVPTSTPTGRSNCACGGCRCTWPTRLARPPRTTRSASTAPGTSACTPAATACRARDAGSCGSSTAT